MQGKHVPLEEPKMDLQSSLKSMEETMANLKLGPAAIGADVPSKAEGVTSAAVAASVGAPSLPEGEASMSRTAGLDVQMEPDKETEETAQSIHAWMTFGRSTKAQTFALRDVPFKMVPVTREVKQLVERLDKEEVIDLFAKFCDLPIIPAVGFSRVITAYAAIKAQKQHDEVMRQPYMLVAGLDLVLEVQIFVTAQWELQGPLISARNALRTGLSIGTSRRRRCASVTRK